MKHAFTKGLFVAATATLIAACSTDDAADQMPVAPGKIEVSLKAALPQSRAQIEVDESNGRFSGSWEVTDELTVYAEGSTSGEETPKFTYDADAKVFKGQLTNATQDWTYQAVYPAVDATPLNIPFGAERTQKGSNFNGAYDPLVSALVTHAGAEPGKTPQGEAVTFGLNRLTAILALTFETDDATVKAEKVKSVALTAAGKTIAAKSFDITLDDQSGALNASEPSETITLSYEAGSEPAAASFKAYFNVPAATYGKLSVVITTEGHTASFDLTDGIELLAGELAYTTKKVSGWEEQNPALSVVWKTNPTFKPVEITSDMTGKCNIVINVPAGIKAFTVTMDSHFLNNEIGISQLDLLNPTGLESMLDMLDFPYGKDILNKTSVPFDLTQAVALLDGQQGQHIFTMNVTDNNGESINKAVTFFSPFISGSVSATIDKINLWENTATISLYNAPEGVSVQYKRSTESEWQNANKSSNSSFEIEPSWTLEGTNKDKQYYSLNKKLGVFAGNTYECQIINNGSVVASGTFETGTGDLIENNNLEGWTTKKVGTASVDYPSSFWGNPNNPFAKTLCTPASGIEGMSGKCAYLQASYNTMAQGTTSGALFTGAFSYQPFPELGGTVNFGNEYDWTARPTGLKLKYKAKIGDVTYKKHNAPDGGIAVGEPDKGVIMICIVDWNSQHPVYSGLNTPTGVWNPTDPTTVTEGEIIGYGLYYISKCDMASTEELSIPIAYYDKVTKPSKQYSLVISCATSAYGDYLNGCDTNSLYVDDFEWVY